MAGISRDAESDERRGLSLKWSLALFALVGFSPAYDLYEAGTVSWVWLAFGVVSWATATGPVAASEFGQRVGARFRAIGVLGRAAVVLLFAAATAWAHVRFEHAERRGRQLRPRRNGRACGDGALAVGSVGLTGSDPITAS